MSWKTVDFEKLRAENVEKLALFKQLDAINDSLREVRRWKRNEVDLRMDSLKEEKVEKTIAAIEEAVHAVSSFLAKGDAVKLNLCRDFPGHSEHDAVLVADRDTQCMFKQTIEMMAKLDLNSLKELIEDEKQFEAIRDTGDNIWSNAIKNAAEIKQFMRQYNMDCD